MHPVYASKFLAKLEPAEQEIMMRSGIVPINDAYMPYWDSQYRHEIYYGGRGSGKSKFIARKLVNKCRSDKYFKWQYSRKHSIDIKESQFDLLKSTISDFGLWREFKFNESTMRVTHRSGNCFIAKGMDDPEKSKGVDEISGFWGMEITEFDQEDLVGVNQNLRTQKAPLQSIVEFNPVLEEHWVRKYYFSEQDRHKLKDTFKSAIALRTTLWDNHFINRQQYADELIAGASGNANIIRVVLEGDWGLTENGNPWLHAFRDDHICKLPFMPYLPVNLSFDFNADPIACTAWQLSPQRGGMSPFAHCIREFGGKIKLEDVCQQILAAYPNSILTVTGDRSGQNQDVGRNQTIYEMIQGYLGLSDRQMHLNTHNLEHADSRLLCNAVFHHYPILIDTSCVNLIADCQKATVDPNGAIGNKLQKDRQDYKMDYFDSMRYMIQTYFLQYMRETYLILNRK